MNTDNNVTISGHHIEVTPALEAEIKNMVNKLRHKFEHITTAHITLKVDRVHPHKQNAEAELNLCGKKEPIFAKVSSDNMYDSLKKLREKLDRQIVKHKESLKFHGDHNHEHDHHHNNALNLDNQKNNKKQKE